MNPKLGNFVRLLASNHDGEVLAAVAALRRTLAADKLDLHDLARVVESSAPAAPASAPRYRSRPQPQPGRYWGPPPSTPRRKLTAIEKLGRHAARRGLRLCADYNWVGGFGVSWEITGYYLTERGAKFASEVRVMTASLEAISAYLDTVPARPLRRAA
ncbi:MAG TPA: hypothetical protein VIJ52_00790 [Pseudolabrys sp.]